MELNHSHSQPANDPSPSLRHHVPVSLQEALSLPAYALTSFLQRQSLLPDSGAVPLILDALASHSPTRAALALADLSGVILNKSVTSDGKAAAHTLAMSLSRCNSLPLIYEAMLSLPTLDAIVCRQLVLQMQDSKFLDATAAAMYSLMRPDPLYELPEQIRAPSFYLPEIGQSSKRARIVHERYSQLARETCEPITYQPDLSARNQRLLSEFRDQIAPKLFPIQNYGYGSIAGALDFIKISQDLWAIKNPWGDTPDAPSLACHQCADSAPAARSFFVSRGIPADVYIMRIGTLYHNVCVAFFHEERPRGIKVVPTLVDASPYNGFYQLNQTSHCIAPSFLNPIGSYEVFKQRQTPVPFVYASGLRADASALAPWCCEDLPSRRARLIGFGGVMASQKYGGWLPERGTPEYYGNGVRTPRLAFSAYVMPYQGDALESLLSWQPFLSLDYHDESGQAVSCGYVSHEHTRDESLAQLRAELLQEVQPIATRHLKDIKSMVERSGYSLAERIFK
jgi:hypothetical protein